MNACVNSLKKRTRKYAKVQTSWIRRHFQPRATIHRLDSTRAGQRWNEEVRAPAIRVLENWLQGKPTVDDATAGFVEVLQPSSGQGHADPNKKRTRDLEDGQAPLQRETILDARWHRFVCNDCDGKVLQGELQWQAHLRSRGHHRCRKRQKRQQLLVAVELPARSDSQSS